MQPDPGFILNGSTLLGVGAILGALSGAITFLFRALLAAKDSQIADQKETLKTVLPALERLTAAIEKLEDARDAELARERERR